MKIQKIATTKYMDTDIKQGLKYNEQYVLVDNNIITKDYALKVFPKLKQDIEEALKNQNAVKIGDVSYPHFYEILKEVEEAKQKIYKNFNLGKTKNEDEKKIQSAVLFNYLSKDFNWDERATEEYDLYKKHHSKLREDEFALKEKIDVLIEELIKPYEGKKQIKEALKNLENNQKGWFLAYLKKPEKANGKDYKKIKTERKNLMTQIIKNNKNEDHTTLSKVLKLEREYIKAYEKRYEDHFNYDNKHALYQVYNGLILKRGVCSQLSYAYSYLLNGLDIENFLVTIQNVKEDSTHILNAIADEELDKTYFADLTMATGYADYYKKINELGELNCNLNGFASSVQDIKKARRNYGISNLKILSEFGINKSGYKMWITETKESGSLKDFRDSLIENPDINAVKTATEYLVEANFNKEKSVLELV